MRLHSITLRNYRGIAERTLEFDDHVTVVSGPNEIGKSSIAEALGFLRTYFDDSRSRELRAVQTVGVDAGPEVEIKLSTGPYELSYRKRWIKQPETALHIWQPTPQQLTGRPAHEKYLAILDETVDVALLDALESKQGESLQQPQLAHLKSLQGALGQDQPSGTEDTLLERIQAEFQRYFTPTGKPTGAYATSRTKLDDARAAVTAAEKASLQMQQFTDEHAHTKRRIEALEEQQQVNAKELAHWRQAATAVQAVQEALETAEANLASASARLRRAEEAHESRRVTVQRIADDEAELEAMRDDVRYLEAEWTNAQQSRDELREALRSRQGAYDEAVRTQTQAGQALSTARAYAQREQLARRCAEARQAEEARRTAEAKLESNVVDDDALLRITTLESELQAARAASEQAAALVRVEALGTKDVHIDGGVLEDGDVTSVPVLDTVTIHVDGVLSVQVEPGKSPDEVQERLDQASAQLQDAYEECSVASLDEARAAAAARHDASRAAERASVALEHILDGVALHELEDQLATLDSRLKATDPPTEDLPALEAAADEATQHLTDVQKQLETFTVALDKQQVATNAAELAHDKARSMLDARIASLELMRERIDQDRASLPDELLEQELGEARETADAATTAREAAQNEFDAADTESVQMWLSNVEGNFSSTEQHIADARSRLTELGALLDDRAGLGLFDALSEAKAQLEAAENEHARLHRAAAAAKVLHEVWLRHRDLAQVRYIAPFKDGLESLARLIFGADLHIEIDQNLRITSRTVAGQTVPFKQLSGGAKEQLALLGRLTCAMLIDEQDGAPLIIDDALGFSDPERLRALGLALSKVGKKAQIILMTCQPDRYQQVGQARRIHLS